MEVHPTEVKELFETTDQEEANKRLRDGWILFDVTRGNLKHSFLLVKI
ncbi:hypothetical protein ACX1C1_21675 [Paenibacillus sp. strain BS8-2]